MYKKLGKNILFTLYQFLRQVRYTFLKSFFGIVIHCKHTPTCGTYTFTQIEKNGILKGSLQGFIRVLRCW